MTEPARERGTARRPRAPCSGGAQGGSGAGGRGAGRAHAIGRRTAFIGRLRSGYLLPSLASELELPRIPPRRPREVLSVTEAERMLAQPDLETSIGLRDRAILETLHSTGMRRKELSRLLVSDVNSEAGIVRIRHGRGKKESVIPTGTRALAWVGSYARDARSQLVAVPDEGRSSSP